MKISICFARGEVVGDGVAWIAGRKRAPSGRSWSLCLAMAVAWASRASGDWDRAGTAGNELEHAALLRLDRTSA